MSQFTEFYNGQSTDAYKLLGCHRVSDGVYRFAVWAPNATAVSVIGDFNNWLVNHDAMTLQDGIWQIELEAKHGDCYKYAIVTQSGNVLYKADPYGTFCEVRPKTASVIYDPAEKYVWNDADWTEKQLKKDVYKSPINIYEVHAGSWRRHYDGRMYSYRDLAKYLVPYVKKMGYTHVEFMPLAEHPLDASWGYQVTGFYAPTSRYGTPDDLRFMIDAFHHAGIGVILDWVPAHFCKDAHGLADFDGTCCYESADEFRKEHKSWGTRIFDYSRYEVQSFLVSNALYWLKEFHFDGLRVDAVASMLYLDYDRKDGEWRPNKWGGKENLEAIEFLKKLSCRVFEACPYALFVAEESTAFPKVTHPTYVGGLGFNYKWNMGWMNDVLSYMQTDTLWRADHHNQLTFGMCYAYSENYILPLSHDEVVHMKGSLINKMFGDYDTKFAQLKTLFGFQYAHPGKKLNFMGSELAQWNEWSEDKELDWMLLTYPKHDSFQRYVRELNKVYKKYKALYRVDQSWEGFKWILSDRAADNVLVFERSDGKGGVILAVVNFSQYDYHNYGFNVDAGEYKLILNSDEAKYGGRGVDVAETLVSDQYGYVETVMPASSVQYYYRTSDQTFSDHTCNSRSTQPKKGTSLC